MGVGRFVGAKTVFVCVGAGITVRLYWGVDYNRAAWRIVIEKITKPVLVVYDNDPLFKFDMLPVLVREHPNWQTVRSSRTRGMPHFENQGETFRNLETFWKQYD